MNNIEQKRGLVDRITYDLENTDAEAIVIECSDNDLLFFEIMFKLNGLTVEIHLNKAEKLDHSLLLTKTFH